MESNAVSLELYFKMFGLVLLHHPPQQLGADVAHTFKL